MAKTISTSEARRKFAEISAEVIATGVEYLVLKNGKPAFKISPPSEEPALDFKAQVKESLDAYTYDMELLADA